MEMTSGPGVAGHTLRDAAAALVTVMRNGEPDLQHLGFACLVDFHGKRRWSLGDPHATAFFRSSAKPLQALAMVESGAADAAGLDAADLAIICGSNLGGVEQTDQVRSVLAKSGLPPESLACGHGLTDTCSGKHAGMLTACRHLGLPVEGYLDPGHPWQRRMLATLCDYCAVSEREAAEALDGCSAPTYSIPIYNMALGFARLGREATVPGAAARLLRAMAEHPGGHTGEPDVRPYRLDGTARPGGVAASGTMRETGAGPTGGANPETGSEATWGPAAFVTKGGANGLHCAALPDLGLGFAMKVIDGSALPRWPVFTRALESAGLISKATAEAMAEELWPKVETRRGVIAGAIRMDF